MPEPATAAASRRVRHPLAVGGALLLVALNLRFALAAVPPVLGDIRHELGLSNVAAGLLTTAPLLCFAAAAPLAPLVARRVGQEALLLACMLTIAAGIALRIVPAVAPLFAGTVLFGVAIAVANVLMPSAIKHRFLRPGVMMALYTTSFSVGSALAAGLSVPLDQWLGSWRWALAAWGIPAVIAGVAWLPETISAGRGPTHSTQRPVGLRTDRVAWLVTGTFGIQSMLFYALLTWLPDILREAGLSSASAGVMLGIALLLGLPASLAVPVIATRLPDQRALAVLPPALWFLGLLGVLLLPRAATAFWMVLLGLGQGAGISLALTLVLLRAPDADRAAALSGMAQGVGYALAAVGPVVLGAVHQATGDWAEPLVLMLIATLALLACGLGAARRRSVG